MHILSRRAAMLASLLLAVCAFAQHGPARAQNLDTTPQWDGNNYITPFGVPEIATFGQTITAPAGCNLSSFTFYLRKNVGGSIRAAAYVYAWDGKKATGPALFASVPFTVSDSSQFVPFTFNTGAVQLTAGAQYVLFFTTSGLQAGQPGGSSNWGYLSVESPYSNSKFVYLGNGNNFGALTSHNWESFEGEASAFKATFVSKGFTVGTLDNKAHARAVVTGFVTLATPAPAGGETVALSSDNPLMIVPPFVVVPEGQSYTPFPVRTDGTPFVYTQKTSVYPTLGAADGNLRAESGLLILPANTARADVYAQDGTLADTNFGTARELQISSDGVGGSGNTRVAYLRFRVGGFHDVSKARLRLDARAIDGGTATLGVYAVPDNHWQQDTLTFNARPAVGALLKTATVTGTTLTHYNIDVTDYVRAAQLRGKDVLSFVLALPRPSASTVTVVSTETVSGAFGKPQLVVQGN